MNVVTDFDLNTKGFSAVEAGLVLEDEVIISVQGQDRYVVMGMDKYAKLRECELSVALQEAKADVASGRMIVESVEAHMKRITDGL